MVGAERADESDCVAGRGGEYFGTLFFSELHGKMSDAAGASMNQHAFTGLQATVIEKSLPCGQCRQRHGTRRHGVHLRGRTREVASAWWVFS
ncbi:hypothetical protein RI103_33365 [Paraburkholderia sp. FT54]|uniref:hypothetical protein n=1 Tax=Paraburkholderia sp. FT54 TaxID=3074437 RepID=UPI002877D72E|nr:hypothetical protein [Paraburkholderia sp. FT54]WNC95140.1 hypothetical protein RI103_33365 [Paraburkholderia sp. FT54]